MEYYGNNDWRSYLRRQKELIHYGTPRHSGRYPWGSGKNPYHHGQDSIGTREKATKRAAKQLEYSRSLIDELNNEWSYGVIIEGKKTKNLSM